MEKAHTLRAWCECVSLRVAKHTHMRRTWRWVGLWARAPQFTLCAVPAYTCAHMRERALMTFAESPAAERDKNELGWSKGKPAKFQRCHEVELKENIT